jgi:hypothetical protein
MANGIMHVDCVWGGSFVIGRGAASIAVKATAEFSQDNPETDGNEIDTNLFVECPPVRLRKLDEAGLSTFRAF